MGQNLLIGGITLVIGLLMLLASTWYTLHRRRWFSRCEKARGRVRSLQQSNASVFVSSSDNPAFREQENMFKGGSFSPVIEFQDKTGRDFEFKGVGSSPPRYRVGDQVEVLYHPDDPEQAVIDGFLDKWLPATLVLAFSGIVLLTGALLLWLLP